MTEESLEKFDQASQDAREERTIITGNMLAAYFSIQVWSDHKLHHQYGKVKAGNLDAPWV